ncbi:MAG: AraC family transcriptional regulator [Calditrichaceae bacterium]|nr:AraC family transcriptional regulator [Calditrichaceae bacterium]MBN2708797.1 AraC family transcriptional regulator [Calditrichaceae bacterium]RQV97673.1 MAG: AraC family transcriptional regulator [Calditrichota bacterium]
MTNTLQALHLLVAFQFFVFSVFLLSGKEGRNTRHILLAVFFLSLSINIFSLFCGYNEYIFNHVTFLLLTGAPFAFLFAPVLYLYVQSLIGEQFRLKKEQLLHTIPFLAFGLYLALVFYFLPPEEKINYLKLHGTRLVNTFTPLLNIQILIYAILGVYAVKSYRKRIKEYYSSIEKINYSWLRFILWGFICLWIVDISRFILHQWPPLSSQIIEMVFFILFSFFSSLILFKALTQPQIFMPQREVQAKKKNLSDSVSQQYQEQLFTYMEKYKPYLDPDLTLFDLSEKTTIPVRSLSEIINSAFNQNFYDYVNSYRIKESQRLLAESAEEKKTVLEILYEVGFNTKSSFNQAFKKHTGRTPTQYKKQQFSSN